MRRAKRISIVLLALAALIVLFVRGQISGVADYDRSVDAARRLGELDQRLESQVREAATSATLEDAALAATLREMKTLESAIESSPSSADSPSLQPYLVATRAAIADKFASVDRFEALDAELRSALTTLPGAAHEAVATAPFAIGLRLRSQITAMLASLLRCNLECNEVALEELWADLDAIAEVRELLPIDGRKSVDDLLDNARLVATLAPKVERAVHHFTVEAKSPFDHLYVAARSRREAAVEQADAYRAGLFALSIAFLVVIVSMLARAHRNAEALGQALASLDREKRVVVEKQRELALLNERLEARVEDRTRELSGSRDEYRRLIETAHAIPWVMAPDGLRFDFVGPQAARILGYSVAEWTGEGFLDRRVHPEDVEAAREMLGALSADGAEGEIELRMISKDRREVWLASSVSTRHDGEGRPVRRGIFLDITSRRMLEAELRSAHKLESLGRLSAGIAHEINTPVQFVSDSVQFLRGAFTDIAALLATYRRAVLAELSPDEQRALSLAAREADDAADTEYLLENVPQAIQSSIEGLGRIAGIIKSLNEFSHPDRDAKSAIDLNANIRSTLTIAANEYKHVADVETDLGALPPVVCHGGEINQVVLNLIVNAAHAIGDVAKSTKTRGRITVRSWREEGFACICVEDTGAGIPNAIHDKIFDPFFTTKEVGRGTGQGLALARRIVVETHGGELGFETVLGSGTAFFLRLPIDGISAKSLGEAA